MLFLLTRAGIATRRARRGWAFERPCKLIRATSKGGRATRALKGSVLSAQARLIRTPTLVTFDITALGRFGNVQIFATTQIALLVTRHGLPWHGAAAPVGTTVVKQARVWGNLVIAVRGVALVKRAGCRDVCSRTSQHVNSAATCTATLGNDHQAESQRRYKEHYYSSLEEEARGRT